MVTASPLSRFERVLLFGAVVVAGALIILRVGAAILVSLLHHFR